MDPASRLGALYKAWAEHDGPSEGGEAACDVDWSRSCKIIQAQLEKPAAWVPFPVRQAAQS